MMLMIITAVVAVLACASPMIAAANADATMTTAGLVTVYPFQNASLPFPVRVDDLISRLTVDEKAQQMVSMSPPIPRLGVNGFNWRSECCHGWGFTGSDWQGSGWNGTATLFPHVIGLAATFDEALVEAVGDMAGTEGRAAHNMARAQGIYGHMMTGLHCFGPTGNANHDGRWGRIKRTWGEDPVLSGVLNAAHVRGLQGGDTTGRGLIKMAADMNMYAVHSGPDDIRTHFSATTSQKDLYDHYLPPFHMGWELGNVSSIMVAYSAYNNTPDNCNSFLMRDVLKQQWGFSGVAFSDNSGVPMIYTEQHFANSYQQAAVLALNASLDQDMASGGPGGAGKPWNYGASIFQKELPAAVATGLASEGAMDEALRRILNIRFRTGHDDPVDMDPWQTLGPADIGSHAAGKLALKAAHESIVMLRNDMGALPLKLGRGGTTRRSSGGGSHGGRSRGAAVDTQIVVIGPNANRTDVLDGGTYAAFSAFPAVSVLAGIQAAVAPGVDVVYVPGCMNVTCPSKDGIPSAVAAVAAAGVSAVVYVGGINGQEIETEGHDRGSEDNGWTTGPPCEGIKTDVLALPGCQEPLVAALADAATAAKIPLVVTVLNGGPVSTPTAATRASALLDVFYPGPAGGTAVADVIVGAVSPAARLPYTVYKSVAQLPNFTDYDIAAGGRTYRYMPPSVEPLYRFGDGLSYAQFDYSPLSIACTGCDTDDGIGGVTIQACASVSVSSVLSVAHGDDSDEVTQAYVSVPAHAVAGLITPNLSLVDFTRTPMTAGKDVNLTFEVTPYQMSTVLQDGSRAILPGVYTLSVGGSQPGSRFRRTPARDSVSTVEQATFTVAGSAPVPLASCKDQRLRGLRPLATLHAPDELAAPGRGSSTGTSTMTTTVPTVTLRECGSVTPPGKDSWDGGSGWDLGLPNGTVQALGVAAPAPVRGPACLSPSSANTPGPHGDVTTTLTLHSCAWVNWPRWKLSMAALQSASGGTIASGGQCLTATGQGGSLSLAACAPPGLADVTQLWRFHESQLTPVSNASECLSWSVSPSPPPPPPPSPGTFTVRTGELRQTLWGLQYEIQSDSIGSGNQGLPAKVSGVPHDLVPSEAMRFYTSMLKGFRYCRLALGLFLRGLDASQLHIQQRWPTQMAELKAMQDGSGIEGFAAEYWSPPPGWKASGSLANGTGGLASYNDTFLQAFGGACAADVTYLRDAGLRVPWWGLQNEPYVTNPGYSSCHYNDTEYYLAFAAAAAQVRALPAPAPRVHASSGKGQTEQGAMVAADNATAALVDMWTWHKIGADSSLPMDNAAAFMANARGKPVIDNEYEYFYGRPGSGNDVNHSTVNTAASIMNWMTFVGSPMFSWLHALKPTYNSESTGYGLGFWRPWDDNNTSPGHFPGLPKGHWQYNPLNWPSVAGFVRYMPWDAVRVDVREDTRRADQRVMAFLTPNGTIDGGGGAAAGAHVNEHGHTGGPWHAGVTPPGLLGVVLTNRDTDHPFSVQVAITSGGAANNDGASISDGTVFCGHRFNRTDVDVQLSAQRVTASSLSLVLPPNAIEFWLQSTSGDCDTDRWSTPRLPPMK